MRKGTKLIAVLCRLVLPHGSTGTDRSMREPNRGYPQPKPWASIPSRLRASADPLTTSFKDTIGSALRLRIMGLIQPTQRLTSFHFDVAHDAYGRHIRPNDPNKPEGEWNYPPTDTVLETAGLRPIEENIRRRRDTALFRFRTIHIYRQCLASSLCLYRYAWYLSSLSGILTLVYVFVRYRYK
jgi:hypothetical protein